MVEAKIVVAGFAAAGAGVETHGFAALGGTTVLEFGSSQMKREVMPKFLSGEWNDGTLHRRAGSARLGTVWVR